MNKTIHNTFLQNCKTAKLQISKLVNYPILFLILFPLWGLGGYSQTFNWDWAVSGGGPLGDLGNERIYDVKVGSDNNYYFIATVYGKYGVQIDGQPVTTYNQSTSAAGGSEDIFLFSTTCDGTVRWSQAIGGAAQDLAYNLVLDGQNNVYVGAYVSNTHVTSDGHPVHFSPTDSIPYPDLNNIQIPQEGFNTAYLVKYDSNGNYIKRKALEGNVDGMEFLPPNLLDLAIDSNDNLHFIIGLRKGTGYLDNNVTVPNTVAAFQYHLAKYDSSLNYVSSMVLPIPDGTGFTIGYTRFTYDQNLDRYYIGGYRKGAWIPLTYDGNSIVNLGFLLAINGSDGSLLWHRELYSDLLNNTLPPNHFTSLKTDTDSNVYIGGSLYKNPNEQNLKTYDPNDTSVQPYIFTAVTNCTIPMTAILKSDGVVQCVQATAAYNATAGSPGPRHGKGIAIKNSEVAFGTQGANEFWDNFEVQRPYSHSPDPLLVRFNKQTGDVIAMHDIMAGTGVDQITAVAVDRDGNYVTGGFFYGGTLFPNTSGIAPLYSAGESDFFVAKLAAYACGTNSTQKFNTLKINVYPNPTNDVINIETDEQLSNYIIYDVSGRQIQSNLFAGSNQINLQNVTTGVYFIKVTTVQGNSGTVRVVKQ